MNSKRFVFPLSFFRDHIITYENCKGLAHTLFFVVPAKMSRTIFLQEICLYWKTIDLLMIYYVYDKNRVS